MLRHSRHMLSGDLMLDHKFLQHVQCVLIIRFASDVGFNGLGRCVQTNSNYKNLTREKIRLRLIMLVSGNTYSDLTVKLLIGYKSNRKQL